MKYRARLTKGAFFEDDTDKLGWIKVVYNDEVRWAMPHWDIGQIKIPTKEWMEKFGSYIFIWVDKVDDSEYLCWTGWALLKLPANDGDGKQLTSYPSELLETITSYPYVQLWFTENWTMTIDDTADKNKFTLAHSDGSYLIIDRTINANGKIEILDKQANGDNKITLDANNLKLQDLNGHQMTMNSTGLELKSSFGDVIKMISGQMEISPANFCKLGTTGSISVNNYPNCLFTGAPHSTNTKIKA